MELLSNEIVLLAITFGVFYASRQLQKWSGWVVLNPILVTIIVLILFLKVTGISYDTYHKAGGYINFWMKPAIVALAVPLYQHLGQIRRQFLPIFLSQIVGCLVGIVSVVVIANMMGASREVIVSLAPKSVTTPIAMEVCTALGGIPSLTAAIVIASACSVLSADSRYWKSGMSATLIRRVWVLAQLPMPWVRQGRWRKARHTGHTPQLDLFSMAHSLRCWPLLF